MKMILLLFSSWPALESLQVVLTWVQGRPDEVRVALEDVFPPWSKQQIRQVDCLAFLCAFKKAGLGSSQDATCFNKGRTRQRWVANS